MARKTIYVQLQEGLVGDTRFDKAINVLDKVWENEFGYKISLESRIDYEGWSKKDNTAKIVLITSSDESKFWKYSFTKSNPLTIDTKL